MPNNGNGTKNRSDDYDTGPIGEDDLFSDEKPDYMPGYDRTSSEFGDEHPDAEAEQDEASEKSLTRRYWWVTVLSGAVATVLSGWFYMLGEGRLYLAQTVVFAMICGLAVTALVLMGFKQSDNRAVQNWQRPDEVQFNFKKTMERDLWVIPEGERKVHYWARMPLMTGIILVGNGFILMVLSFWVVIHAPGARSLFTAITHGEVAAIVTAIIITFICIRWSLFCFKEKPLQAQARAEDKEWTIRFGKRRGTVRPYHLKILGLIPAAALWWWLKWPIAGWYVHRVIDDPYRIAWVAAIPSVIWTLARAAYWWGSFIGVTTNLLIIGSTGYLLGDNLFASMFREDMTNTFTYQPWLGRLFGYGKFDREGKGQLDAEFRNVRMTREPDFQRFTGKPARR